MSRANKIYQSFTAGLNRSDADKTFFGGNKLSGLSRDKDEKMDEDEQQRILRIIEQEESSSDEDEDTSSENDKEDGEDDNSQVE